MNKNLMAVGVAAALGAMSGVANAGMTVNANGTGHINILPYYSVQEGNITVMSITNTDTTNGKAVKVRFRGAQFSDDVFDFQIFMSPGDVWTGAVSLNGNVAKMVTNDKSCTLPASVNQDFVTARLLDANKVTGTREGYVEIINMGDIKKFDSITNTATVSGAGGAGTAPAVADALKADGTAGTDGVNDLYATIKHATSGATAGTAACATAVLVGTAAIPKDLGPYLSDPTDGLTSFATILNVAKSKAFTFPATAMSPDFAGAGSTAFVPQRYARQANLNNSSAGYASLIATGFGTIAESASTTADYVFNTTTVATTVASGGGGNVTMYEFDLPDLSSPYGHTNVTTQLAAMQVALGKSYVQTEFGTDPAITAATDVILSQPTRRYYYTWYDVPNATSGDTLKTLATVAAGKVATPYASLVASTNAVTVGAPEVYDREERPFSDPSQIVISPNPAGSNSYTVKTEVAVVSINNGSIPSGALAASLGAQDYTFKYTSGGSTIYDGWVTLSTTGADGALPIIGFAAVNVFNGGVANGTNYGQVLPLKW